MRAIGAQRQFMLLLVMVESLMIAFAAGLVGTVISLVIFYLLNENGIPATNDIAKFFGSATIPYARRLPRTVWSWNGRHDWASRNLLPRANCHSCPTN